MAESKMRHFENLLKECDADIRAGRTHQVARRLAQIGTGRIPRAWRLPLAKICRRAGLYGLGLRLLNRLVNGPNPRSTHAELTEYSALLIRSGAVEEALQTLRGVNVQEVPESSLIRAFALFSRWEYDQAIPALENYLETSLSDAERLVGRSNLALALVETRQHGAAVPELEENIRMARQQGYAHLETYNASLLAQVYLQDANFAAARRLISSAVLDDAKSQSNNDWSALKLKLVLDGLEAKDSKPLLHLRQLARERRDWSAIRDADLYLLKVDFKEEAFLHLYFGSPLPGFRERIRQELGRVPERRVYVLGKKSSPRFDLERGEIDGRAVMRAGMKCHQLLAALLRDFYQPLRIGGLHAALFPGDHFNIMSSPGRVHQLLRRTRRWLADNHIPVSIGESEGFYSLSIDGDFSFRIPIDHAPDDLFTRRIESLEAAFPSGQMFTAHDVQDRLRIAITSAHRVLKQAMANGKIERIGNPKRPLGYRCLSPSAKAKAAV